MEGIVAAMQTTLFSERAGTEELQITCNINVVIAFEDVEAGKYAEAFYEHLKERLGVEFEFTRYQWSFALLEDPHVREAAGHDAATADIIIVTTHGQAKLPASVDSWFQEWVGRNSGPMALVALFDRRGGDSEAREGVRSALSRIAQSGRMDFFAEPSDASNTEFVNRLVGKV